MQCSHMTFRTKTQMRQKYFAFVVNRSLDMCISMLFCVAESNCKDSCSILVNSFLSISSLVYPLFQCNLCIDQLLLIVSFTLSLEFF